MAKRQVVLTKHAEERRAVRRVSKDAITQTVHNSDDSKLEDDGDTQFIKSTNGRQIHVVAKPLPEENKWLVKTVWVRGEDDPNPILKLIITWIVRFFRR